MSLSLDVLQPNGVIASFWTLNSIQLNAITHIATIQMDGYFNSNAQISGYLPLTSITISVTFIPTNIVPNISVMTALYNKISLDPFFNGAIYNSDDL